MKFVKIVVLLLGLNSLLLAQVDKIYLTNNKIIKCKFSHVFQNKVFYKLTDTSQISSIEKSKVALIKCVSKTIYVTNYLQTLADDSVIVDNYRNKMFINPFGFVFGNLDVAYQRKIWDGNAAFFFPLKLNYDNTQNLTSMLNRNNGNTARIIQEKYSKQMALGLKFFFGINKHRNFFIGPRIIYSQKLIGNNWEGIGLQTNLGWDFRTRWKHFSESLQFSFGFAKSTEAILSFLPQNKNWAIFHVNYYIGFDW